MFHNWGYLLISCAFVHRHRSFINESSSLPELVTVYFTCGGILSVTSFLITKFHLQSVFTLAAKIFSEISGILFLKEEN